MAKPFQRLRRFLSELRRRNVYRVAVTYAVVAFVVWQVANLLFPALGFPSWTVDFVIVLTLLGFPLSLVVAWAFEVTPGGVRRTPEAEPVEESGTPAGETRTAYKVLVGLGLVAATVAGGWYLIGGGGGQSPEVSKGTVAVLPFQVSGAGAEEWRDGMVTYLTLGLDGAAGLRAIPDRTVLARWEESGQVRGGATTEEALAVAREIGSQYAVVGSAGELGSQVRFTVGVYETSSGERLGQVEVRGSPDSIPSLADSLSRRVLGVVLEESGQEIPSVELASLTTASLPALKSYLAGERHFRAGEYEAAVEDFKEAVERDSTFALAYVRLSGSYGWLGEVDQAFRYTRRAYSLSDRLPERERRLLRVEYLRDVEDRAWIALDSLRRLTEAYPDDPSVWYELGETLAHEWIPVHWGEAENAFRRAVELDPGVAGYHNHLVDVALFFHRDSALAARRIAAHPGEEYRDMFRVAADLMFGAREHRKIASERLAGSLRSLLPAGDFRSPWAHGYPVWHPQDLELQGQVIRKLADDEKADSAVYAAALARNRLQRGQVRTAVPLIRNVANINASAATCLVAWSVRLGYPLPDSITRPLVSPSKIEEHAPLRRLRCSGYYLIEQGRGDDISRVESRIRDRIRTGEGDGKSPHRLLRSTLDELRAYRAWKEGDTERAVELLGHPRRASPFPFGSPIGVIWWGDLQRRLGHLERARGWYMRAWPVHPVAHERLGRLYEKMGKPKKAAVAYRRFIAGWEDADPELQPRVEKARGRLEKLTAAEADGNE